VHSQPLLVTDDAYLQLLLLVPSPTLQAPQPSCSDPASNPDVTLHLLRDCCLLPWP
jgi:hypothetical protein